MPSTDEIKQILVQLGKLETKIDHVLTIVPIVHMHETRLSKVEVIAAHCDENSNRLDAIERKHSYFVGVTTTFGLVASAVAWFTGVFHDLFGKL